MDVSGECIGDFFDLVLCICGFLCVPEHCSENAFVTSQMFQRLVRRMQLWLNHCSEAMSGKCSCHFSFVPKPCQEKAFVTFLLFESHVRRTHLSLLFCSKALSGEHICHFSFVPKPCREKAFVTFVPKPCQEKAFVTSLLFQSHVGRIHWWPLLCCNAMSGD